MNKYRVCLVDGDNPDKAYEIMKLHKEIFFDTAPLVAPWDEDNYSWLVYQGKIPIGFAILSVEENEKIGYLCRAGILKEHRGNGLQIRLIRAREKKARSLGVISITTDTSDNPASENSLRKTGYKTYTPLNPWAWNYTIYWRKTL